MKNIFEKVVWFNALLLFVVLCFAVLEIDGFPLLLDELVEQNMQISGVRYEVTAVLLNFRSLDTLLEIAVILCAMVGIYTVYPHFRYRPRSFASTVTDTYVALLVPLIFLSSLYILSSGLYQSGGAFQASALIAGGIIIVKLIKPTYLSDIKATQLRFVYSIGLFVFILVGFISLYDGYFLQYNQSINTFLIITIETFLTFSLGATLAAFFIIGVHRFKT